VFKLRDLLKKAGGLRPGCAVVELGCWPGGWLQVLAEEAGRGGRVLGVDLRRCDPLPGIQLVQLDFTEPSAGSSILAALEGRAADAVLSDAAPTLSGIRDVDRAAADELYAGALQVAAFVLRPGGFVIVKGFPGPGADSFRRELRSAFARVSEVRPEGRRRTSQEFYWVATGFDASSRGCAQQP
jgi:23S rRNA (uridine2552-2'-O)-methyltransferase